MSRKEYRVCTGCGTRVRGPVSAFQKPIRCPKCGKVGIFEREKPKKQPADYVRLAFGNEYRVVVTSTCILGLWLIIMIISGDNSFWRLMWYAVPAAATILCIVSFRTPFSYEYMLSEIEDELEETRSKLEQTRMDAERDAQQMRIALDDVQVQLKEKEEAIRNFGSSQNQEISGAVKVIAEKYISDAEKWYTSSLTPNNFASTKKKIGKVVSFCKDNGYDAPKGLEKEVEGNVQTAYEEVLRKDFEKKEQKRIKDRIREEQRFEREKDKELKRLAAQEEALREALEKAMNEAQDEHDANVELLKQQLAEAEERNQRAVSQAQLTKAGHVYVISNIGSFGNDVFKVGMTRRLEPLDRVKELGDASVPFPFDVHMMIFSEDAPTLESSIHKELHKQRVNRANLRKEFFRTSINDIVEIVKRSHGQVEYVADPEALEYHESLAMDDEDFDFVSAHVGEIEEEDEE